MFLFPPTCSTRKWNTNTTFKHGRRPSRKARCICVKQPTEENRVCYQTINPFIPFLSRQYRNNRERKRQHNKQSNYCWFPSDRIIQFANTFSCFHQKCNYKALYSVDNTIEEKQQVHHRDWSSLHFQVLSGYWRTRPTDDDGMSGQRQL